MESKDLDAVAVLLKKYLDRFDMAPKFTKEELDHWLLYKGDGEQVAWCYVVEVRTICNDYSALTKSGPDFEKNH